MTVASPTSENFDEVATGTLTLPTTIGGLVYTAITNAPANTITQNVVIESESNDANHFLYYYTDNFGHSNSSSASVTDGFALTAANGGTFSLESLKIDTDTGGTITITGYDAQGAVVTSDTMTPGQDDTDGSVSVTTNTDTYWGNTFTLDFSSAWAGVSKVTFTVTDSDELEMDFGHGIIIDDLVLKSANVDLASGSDSGISASDHITNVAAPVLTGSADGGAILDVVVDGNTLAATTVTAEADGTFTISDLATLLDGAHTVTVTEEGDSAASASVTFTVDTVAQAPTDLVLDTTYAVGAVTSDFTPTITGAAEANATVTLYDGTTIVGSATANSAGVWSITTTELADGAHTLTAVQVDVAGNVSSASAGLAITVDSGRPSAPVLVAASDTGASSTDHITNDTTPTLTGTATANAAVTLYDGEAIVGYGVADADGKWSITVGDGMDSPTALLSGNHSLHAAVTSPDETVLDSAALTITVDTVRPVPLVAPVLAVASDTGTVGDNITTNHTPTLTGQTEANATVQIYDGETLVATTTADADGEYSVATHTLSTGTHTLTAVATDVAGNASETGLALELTIKAVPVAASPTTTVDGVAITTTVVTTATGAIATSIAVPVVTADRVESSGSSGVADIPLATKDGATLLTAQVHTGFGLNATGATVTGASDASAELIAAIKAVATTHASTDVDHLTTDGAAFLALLPTDGSLLVQTVTLTGTADGSAVDLVAASSATDVALVVDGTGVAAGTAVTLTNIPFASVFGALDVTASGTGQILSGDSAGQTFHVSSAAGAQVLAGGGADTLVFTAASDASGGSAADVAAGSSATSTAATTAATTTTTLLHGGSGADTAVFSGAMAAYTITSFEGHVLVASTANPDQVAEVVNVESLQFADQTVSIATTDAQTTIAGLYETIAGRQADLGGFEYWSAGAKAGLSLGAIAVDMIESTEGAARFGALTGDATHDVDVLYSAIFDRAADAGGSAYWVGQMANGMTLAEVADQMAHSAEIVGHQQAATAWDFTV